METTRRTLMIVGLSGALALAACGGGTAATSGPGGPAATNAGGVTEAPGVAATQAAGPGETVDACALLTAAEIEDVTGLATASTLPGPQGGIFDFGCLWELVDDNAMVPPSISFGIMKTGGRAYYDQYFAPFNAENDYPAIEGLGDEAVEADAGAVHVVAGDTFFQVQYLGGGFGGADDDTRMATELAKKIVATLGG